MHKKLTKAQLRKAIDDAFGDEGIFITEVAPGIFRVGMGKGNPPVYTGRDGVLAINKGMWKEFERQYGKSEDKL